MYRVEAMLQPGITQARTEHDSTRLDRPRCATGGRLLKAVILNDRNLGLTTIFPIVSVDCQLLHANHAVLRTF